MGGCRTRRARTSTRTRAQTSQHSGERRVGQAARQFTLPHPLTRPLITAPTAITLFESATGEPALAAGHPKPRRPSTPRRPSIPFKLPTLPPLNLSREEQHLIVSPSLHLPLPNCPAPRSVSRQSVLSLHSSAIGCISRSQSRHHPQTTSYCRTLLALCSAWSSSAHICLTSGKLPCPSILMILLASWPRTLSRSSRSPGILTGKRQCSAHSSWIRLCVRYWKSANSPQP